MKKLLSACAVLALAIGLVVAPGAVAKKGPKSVPTFVTVNVTPNPVVAGATATATGNVSATSNCRKFRMVQLDWVNTTTLVVTPVGTVPTGPNGDYLGTPTAPAAAGTYVLRATVLGPVTRQVGSKKKRKNKPGRQFSCLASSPTDSALPVTVATPTI